MSRGSYTSSLVAVGALVAFSACVALAANAGESQAALYATTTSSRVAPAVGGAPLRAPRSPVQAADALQTPAAVARQYTRPSAARSMSHDTTSSGFPKLVSATCLAALAIGGALFAVARLLTGRSERMPVWDLVEVAETYGTDRPIAMAAATATVEESDMVEKAPGVLFNRVAREWRCKWSADDDQASLVAAQKVLDKHLAALKSLDGVEVQRVVCGGCKDFKVVTSVPAADFGAWENAAHAPEAEFLAELEAIDGISQVETQTYTFQTLEAAPVPDGPLQEKAPGVMFNRVAREWRCKWSDDKDSASLVEAQQVIDELLPQLRALPGAQVQRVVCGGCKDLKVITSVPAENFAAWQEVRFKPEENFLNEVTSIRGITQVEVQTYTLQSLTGPVPPGSPEMNEKAKGVYFNRVAREWRCKWSPDDDEASLVAAQKLLEKYLPKLEAMEGVQVQRVVCGGCKDFKIMTSVPADAFGGWMDAEFAPEAEFLEELKAIPGISQVETQMFTLQPLDGTPVVESEMKEKAPGVLFNRVAREWRCKWSDDNNDASLVAAQKVLDAYLPALTARTGARVQRVVCGGCKDFKVVTSVPADDFGVWMDEDFSPEDKFLEELKKIEGISQVETQMYTFQTL